MNSKVKQGWGGKREGAGRPEAYGEPTEPVTVFLPRSLARRLRRGLGRSTLSQRIVELLVCRKGLP